jgi:amino acid transporter
VKLTNTIQYITSWIILSIFVGLFSIPLCGLKTALRIGSVLILVAFAVALISLIVGWFKGSKLV